MSNERPSVKGLADLATANSMGELIERVANGPTLLPLSDMLTTDRPTEPDPFVSVLLPDYDRMIALAKAAGEYADAHEALRGTTHGTITQNIKRHAAAREALLAAVQAMRAGQ